MPRIRRSANGKPPLPRSIRRLIEKRSQLFARYKATGLEQDAENFRRIRNSCKEKVRAFFQRQQRAILMRARDNRTVLYNYIRRARKTSPSPLAVRLADGSPATDPSHVAELFRSYFHTQFSVSSSSSSHPDLNLPPISSHLSHFSISVQEVEDNLLRLNPFSSMGPDEIHPRILKESAIVLATPYATLFQRCLDIGVFPYQWKAATVTPIFKKGDRHSPVSYRPISLTSVPCKIFERIIKREILSHLRDNSLLTPFQHGFLPGRSCITNMLTVMDSLTQAYDDGKISHAIFIDFAKAFDRVPHDALLFKLERYGIVNQLLSLLRSFLSDRTFSVRIGNSISNPSPITNGVPQGSVLGPLLFLVYINDLPSSIATSIAMYADDVTIWSTSATELQSAMDSAKRWSTDWSLPINDEKCISMSFGDAPDQLFWINTLTQIQRVDQHKILGFWLCSNLSFSSHQQKASKSAFRVLNFIRRSFPQISKEDFKLLYGTYIRPLLEYGSQIVHSGLVRDRDSLERIQRASTKMVRGLFHTPYPIRLIELNLYPLESRRIRADLFLVYHLFCSGLVDQFFSRPHVSTLRGHSKKLFLPRPRTTLRHNFFTFRVIALWNSLPEEVVEAQSKDVFKTRLDEYLGLTHNMVRD